MRFARHLLGQRFDSSCTSTADPAKSDAITLTINPTDAAGNVYAAGDTLGAIEGTNVGGNDVFVRSYGP